MFAFNFKYLCFEKSFSFNLTKTQPMKKNLYAYYVHSSPYRRTYRTNHCGHLAHAEKCDS